LAGKDGDAAAFICSYLFCKCEKGFRHVLANINVAVAPEKTMDGSKIEAGLMERHYQHRPNPQFFGI
jgi:hypothetical protein